MQLSKFITRFIFTTVFISTLLAFFVSILYQYNNYEKDKNYIKQEFGEQKKREIQREVLSVYNLIEHKELILEKALNERIKERVHQAYNTAYSIYNQNKDIKTSDEIKYLIAKELNNTKYEDENTYFFINSNKGQSILFNKKITLDSYNDIWNLKDGNGEFLIQKQAKMAIEQKEGFLSNFFVKPNSPDQKQYSKISFIKLFEPFDWHIGMGEYVDDIREKNQKEILEWISSVRFGKDGYIFVNSFDKKALVFDGKIMEKPTNYPNEELFKQQMHLIKNPDGGFFSYKFKKLDSIEEFDKIAFVKSYDKYNWIIGSGVYLDELKYEINRKETIFKETINNQIASMFLLFFLVLMIVYMISKNMARFINSNILTLISSFEKASKENVKINTQNLTYKEFISLGNSLNSILKEKNETEEKLSNYIRMVNENIIISSTDMNGIITNVSEAFCEISGYTKDELIGKSHNIIKHPNEQSDSFKNLWKNILSGKEWKGEIRNVNKFGKEYWVFAVIRPIFDKNDIVGFTAVKTNITDKKHIEYLSITDELTKLYNRRFFNTKINEELNRAKRENITFSLMIIDVDFFKQYNDTYGHQAGDLALEKVSEVLKNKTNRASDFAFRLGGEEFGIITALPKDKSLEFATLIKDSIQSLKIEHNSSKISKFITVSIGVVSKQSDELTNSDELYKEADDCLYEAKKLGRNCIFMQK